jgi:transposase
MRPNGSPKTLEARRRKVIALLDQGLSLHEIAHRLGCHPSSVMRWRNALEEGGPDALKAKPAAGRPSRLTARQKRRLVKLLLKGARAHGYRTELWTTLRVAEVIRRTMGVTYHRNHVAKLLHQLGWSHQKPERRAIERNEKRIEQWKRNVWPRVKKTPRGWTPTSSFLTNPASS